MVLSTRLARSEAVFVALVVAGVVVCGALVVIQPLLLLALAGAVVLVGVSFLPPVPLLVLYVCLTAIVPYGVQNSFGIGGGSGSPGLLLSDVLLLAGLVRAVPVLFHLRLPSRVRLVAVAVAAFLVIAFIQFTRGVLLGRSPSTAGAELRVLMGFGALLIALPILADRRQRGQLFRLLPAVGLAVGAWGIVQWVLQIEFSGAGDSGVQAGVRFATSGRGQLQGGLFAFPVAALMALAGLMSDEVRSLRSRLVLLAIVALNLLSLLLTYERTFWVATTLAAAVLVAKAGGSQRLRAVTAGAGVVLLSLALLSTLAPDTLAAARERLLSLSQYSSDDSVRFRVTETVHVAREIAARPVTGSGLGATIFFGRPWDRVPPESLTFAHNGYLWLMWKLGIPAAALVLVPFVVAVGWFRRPRDGSADAALGNGCRAALLALAVASVTFPSFNQLSITPTLGLLIALSFMADRPTSTSPAQGERGDVALTISSASR
ncbi:MAG: O-antigen ligase family protein [Actinomycetota bacterium]|nr:O-antigen ligase family protein [Actinomycetota bacterium]